MSTVRSSVVQGFKWGCREGPLCEEPMRNVKFRIIDCSIARNGVHRSGGQIIPAARKATYSAFMSATPRLMEPINFMEVQAVQAAIEAAGTAIERRRGRVFKEEPIPGTPFFRLSAYIPAIDTFGLETDLRSRSAGAAFGVAVFDHWDIVPGDPMDKTIVLRPLEPASGPRALARDFAIKMRRRKGLGETIRF